MVLVEVETDAGITGIGESVASLAAEGTVAALRRVEPLFVGQPVHDVARLVHEARHLGSFNHTPWYADFVLAGVEMALWDAIGKAAGQPVYRLLGGAVRDEVDYFGFVQGDTTDELVEDARELAAAGYGVIYLKVGRGDDADLANTAAVREAIGDRRLRLDPNCAWSVPDAIRMIHTLEPLRASTGSSSRRRCSASRRCARSARRSACPSPPTRRCSRRRTSTTSAASAPPTSSCSRRTRPAACWPSARPPPSPRPAGVAVCLHGQCVSGITDAAQHHLGLSTAEPHRRQPDHAPAARRGPGQLARPHAACRASSACSTHPGSASSSTATRSPAPPSATSRRARRSITACR